MVLNIWHWFSLVYQNFFFKNNFGISMLNLKVNQLCPKLLFKFIEESWKSVMQTFVNLYLKKITVLHVTIRFSFFLVANAFLLLSSLFLHISLDIIGQIVLFCVFILITEMNVKENVCVYIGCHSITTIFSVAHDMTL